jgi:hypothetical protein
MNVARKLIAFCLVNALTIQSLWGCPFCTAVGPSLAQQRDLAAVVALAEVTDASTRPPQFLLHRVVKGADLLADRQKLSAIVDTQLKPGSLMVLFGNRMEDSDLRWSAVGVNEASAAYFLRAPSLREPETERLRYFARFLENPDPLVADDAYREFGRAPFDTVAKVSDQLPSDRLRTWLANDKVPEARKGFYGLALGLEQNPTERATNTKFLKELIVADASDFRAGFDGILGGYLLLAAEPGLELIEQRLLANPQARVGDVRHALTALRFYHEFGQEISDQRLQAALAKVLARPEFAEAAITDLARWQAWRFCGAIAALYDRPNFNTPEIQRAIVGYLRVCPERQAHDSLAELRRRDPQGVADAEAALEALGKLPRAD